MSCTYKPEDLDPEIGITKCPQCGIMIFPGNPHPNTLDSITPEELEQLSQEIKQLSQELEQAGQERLAIKHNGE